MKRKSIDASVDVADQAELEEIDRRIVEIDAERRGLTDRRRRVADRLRKRRCAG